MIWPMRLLVAFMAVAGITAQQVPQVPQWPPGTPDLPADPAITFGRLENGLRFAFRHHDKPAGRCSLRLVVEAGSRDEGDDERGMAHFVEHMAFNGTRRFPGNSIDEWFRSRGMRPGLHSNAFTSYASTEYRIDLPDSGTDAVTDGLAVLREFADGLLFDPAEVEAEKGVIDAEERERPRRERAMKALADRLGAGARRPLRPPMGTPAERARFTAESLRAFHERWYRADTMILVVVGDLDAKAAEAACRSVFGSLREPVTPLPERAAAGLPSLADTSFSVDDPDRGEVESFVMCPVARAPEPDSSASRRRAALRTAARETARWILVGEARRVESPILAVSVAEPVDLGFDEALEAMVVTCSSKPGAAEPALARCARVVRRIRDQGFPDELLDRVREKALSTIEHQRERQHDASCAAVATWLAEQLAAGDTPIAADFEAQLLREVWNGLTAAACSAEFRAAWACERPSITTIGPPGHGFDGLAVWVAAAAAAPAAPSDAASGATAAEPGPAPADAAADAGWPYAMAADGAPPEARTHDARLDVDDVRFANGARLLVKRTSIAKGEIQVAVSVGLGSFRLTDDEKHAAQAFGLALPQVGLGKLSGGHLRRLAATRRASVRFRFDQGRFELRGATNREHLAFQLEWLRAQCADPGIDRHLLDQAVQQHLLGRAPDGAPGQRVEAFLGELAGESIAISPERLAAVGASGVRDFLGAHWFGAPITIVVVGDVDVDEVVAVAAGTFGRMAKRERSEDLMARVPYRTIATGVHRQQELATADASGMVTVCAPLSAAAATGNTPALRVLCRILDARLDTRVRELMSATYQANVGTLWLGTSRRCSAVFMQMRVAPGQEEAVCAATLAELTAVCASGVTAAEVEAVLKQLRNEWNEKRATNAYWLTEIGMVHVHPTALDDLAGVEAEFAAVSPDDVVAMARQCIAPGLPSTLVLKAKSGSGR